MISRLAAWWRRLVEALVGRRRRHEMFERADLYARSFTATHVRRLASSSPSPHREPAAGRAPPS